MKKEEKQRKKVVQVAVRLDEETLKEYKKWLIDNGYRSINQHLNEIIRELITKGFNGEG